MSFERELMNDLPPWWRRTGRKSTEADPTNHVPREGWVSPEVREARAKPGNCCDCGDELPPRSGRGRPAIRCKPCQSKGNSERKAVSRGKAWSTRGTVGTIPWRSRAFVKSCIFINRRVPKWNRLLWLDHDFEGASLKAMPGFGKEFPNLNGFTSEWDDCQDPDDFHPIHGNGCEGLFFRRPVINHESAVNLGTRRAFGPHAEGSPARADHVLQFMTESEALPKGVEPERVGAQVCDECGEGLVILPARGRDVQAKVGAKVLACPKCGLIPIHASVVSIKESSEPDGISDLFGH